MSRFGSPRRKEERIDITKKIQQRVNEKGYGRHLKIGSEEDLEELFGKPCEAYPRNVCVTYSLKGKHLRTSIKVNEPSKTNRGADGKHLIQDLIIKAVP
jgi:hypothetical protein